MIIHESPDRARTMLEQARRRHLPKRVGGIHVTDLLYCLRQTFYNKVLGTPGERHAEEGMALLLGEAFHQFLEPSPEVPLEHEGLHGTPDIVEFVSISDADGTQVIRRPVEIKSTKYSAKKSPIELGHYIDQVAAYAYMLGSRLAAIAVLHIMGDYGQNRNPILKVWDLEFTQEELDRWWLRLHSRRSRLDLAFESGTPPDPEERLPWVCDYCPFFKLVCPGSARARWGLNFADTSGDKLF